MTVIEIVQAHLVANGYDGLLSPCADCGCLADELAPCGSDCSQCEPGYRGVMADDPDEWAIYLTKDAALASVQAAQSNAHETGVQS